MNTLVKKTLTEYPKRGTDVVRKDRSIKSLARPTRNRKLSEHLCLLNPRLLESCVRIKNCVACKNPRNSGVFNVLFFF